MARWIRMLAVVGVVALPGRVEAYGVLTHEAIIDAAWSRSIEPILRARFHPSAEALRRAKAFAYGGSLIQDIGYYPLSGVMFGALTHYARTGDFVAALLRESRTLDEESFALGALAHYVADAEGHPAAVNRSVPLMYPKLAAKFGTPMTYADDPTAHLRTEFGFDVLQVARGLYPPQAYRDFIGFEIARPVLERAFTDTYGLTLDDVLPHFDLSIGTFRYAVSTVIPAMTKVAWETKQKEIERRFPDTRPDQVTFTLSRRDYEDRWGQEYKRPNFLHTLLSWLLRLMPPVGPFRGLKFEPPTPAAEQLFAESFDRTLDAYRQQLARAADARTTLRDLNLDTGQPVRAGSYGPVDETYARWAEALIDREDAQTTSAVRGNILAFYGNLDAPIATKSDRDDWQKLRLSLAALRDRR
jgi:hypothetical protein